MTVRRGWNPDLTAIRRDAAGNRRAIPCEVDSASELRRRLRARRVALRREMARKRRATLARRRAQRWRERQQSPAPPPGQQRRVWPWVVCALVASISFTAWSRPQKPDPHFLRAQQLVADYELGKAPEQLNYGDPVYVEALDELRRVALGSISTASARRMENELSQAVEAFRAARQAGRSRSEARLAAERERRRTHDTASHLSREGDRLPARLAGHPQAHLD